MPAPIPSISRDSSLPGSILNSSFFSQAENLYQSAPTEENLHLLLRTYQKNGEGLKSLQLDFERARKTVFDLPQRFHSPETTQALFYQNDLTKTKTHLLGLIQASPLSDLEKTLHQTSAHLFLGNLSVAVDLLKKGKETPGDPLLKINLLHRLASLAGTDFDLGLEVLKEAEDLIKNLSADSHLLLQLQNLELTAQLKSQQIHWHLRQKKIDETQARLMLTDPWVNLSNFCKNEIQKSQDPVHKKILAGKLLTTQAELLEKQLDFALLDFDRGERSNAYQTRRLAFINFDQIETEYGPLAETDTFHAAAGRSKHAKAYYMLRTFHLDEALQWLHKINQENWDSPAAFLIKNPKHWPTQYGLVDVNGEITPSINRRESAEALKMILHQLSEERGRDLVACGIGAAAIATTSLVMGEKVTGLGIFGGCLAASLLDRSALILQRSEEISFAYRTGMSRVSMEQAFQSLGLYGFNLLTAYLGGSAAALTQKFSQLVLSEIGLQTAVRLQAMGIHPGPWMRAFGSFAFKEIPMATASAAFHQATHKLSNQKSSRWQDYLTAYLWFRLPVFFKTKNPACYFIGGSHPIDHMARGAAHTLLTGSLIQLSEPLLNHEIPKSPWINRLADTTLFMGAIHVGMKGVHRTFPLEPSRFLKERTDVAIFENLKELNTSLLSAGGGDDGPPPALAFAPHFASSAASVNKLKQPIEIEGFGRSKPTLLMMAGNQSQEGHKISGFFKVLESRAKPSQRREVLQKLRDALVLLPNDHPELKVAIARMRDLFSDSDRLVVSEAVKGYKDLLILHFSGQAQTDQEIQVLQKLLHQPRLSSSTRLILEELIEDLKPHRVHPSEQTLERVFFSLDLVAHPEMSSSMRLQYLGKATREILLFSGEDPRIAEGLRSLRKLFKIEDAALLVEVIKSYERIFLSYPEANLDLIEFEKGCRALQGLKTHSHPFVATEAKRTYEELIRLKERTSIMNRIRLGLFDAHTEVLYPEEMPTLPLPYAAIQTSSPSEFPVITIRLNGNPPTQALVVPAERANRQSINAWDYYVLSPERKGSEPTIGLRFVGKTPLPEEAVREIHISHITFESISLEALERLGKNHILAIPRVSEE